MARRGKEARRPRVTVVSDFHKAGWDWIAGYMGDEVEWRFEKLAPYAPDPLVKVRRVAQSLAIVRRARHDDVIVSHQAGVTRLVEIARRTLRAPPRHIGYSFNFMERPGGRSRALWRRALSTVERLVVSSAMEAPLYSDWFGLPLSRIDFVRWGVGPLHPAPDGGVGGDYVCAIGGNMRDYRTLMAAAARLPDVPFVCVLRPENLIGLNAPSNVRTLVDLPLDQTLAILRDSRAMILPLLGDKVPCGHVTLVYAAALSIPIVATASSGIADYVDHGVSGLLVPPTDPAALAAAIERLWSDPDLAGRLAETGRAFAQDACREENYVAHFRAFLDATRAELSAAGAAAA